MKSILNAPLLAVILLAKPALAEDSASIRLPLQNTGVDTDATGQFVAQLNSSTSMLTLNLNNLAPATTYTVTNGQAPEAEFLTDTRGRARVVFSVRPKRATFPLDFDPRGQLLAVRLDGTSVLQAVISAEGEPSTSTVVERVAFEIPGSNASAVSQFVASNDGRQAFSIQIKGVTGTNYLLYVDGVSRGAFTIRGSKARIDFNTSPVDPGALLLDFDPRGKVIDIAQDENLLVTGTMAAQAANLTFATPRSQSAFIPSTGIDPDGTARVKLKVERDARRKCSIELEDMPVGTYQLLANGTAVANIEVTTNVDHTEGEVEFSNGGDDSDELPLTFDPETSVFTVQREGSVYFQGALAYAGSGGAGTNTATSLGERLASTGLDPDASAEAEFEIDDGGEQEFSVEIEDVPAGEYELWVGGLLRGTIAAELNDDDEIEGEIEFGTGDDEDELPLNFDPRGLLIEVKNTSGTFFSHTFGNGDGNSGPSAAPFTIKLPYFSMGTLPGATAEMKFKRDDDGEESFEVEIDDAPLGSYELWVGSVMRGNIVVSNTDSGTHGEVEFEESPDSGDLLLDFDPRGELISIIRDGVTHFERLLPDAL